MQSPCSRMRKESRHDEDGMTLEQCSQALAVRQFRVTVQYVTHCDETYIARINRARGNAVAIKRHRQQGG